MDNDNNAKYLMPASVILAIVLAGYAWASSSWTTTISTTSDAVEVELPVSWNDLGAKIVSAGVIDRDQFEALYEIRGGLSDSEKQLLEENQNEKIIINSGNAGLWLNLLWALGLGNKNEILEKGPMNDPQYGDPSRFASTGGWTLSEGNMMNHYSAHSFMALTPEQQTIVEEVSKNIYRPCCGNSVYFPDCNHGMAMLGLLELMASQGINEDEMYKTALQMNTLWFPGEYKTIAKYFESRGLDFKNSDPKKILGSEYSSASGYRRVLSQVEPVNVQGKGCGI